MSDAIKAANKKQIECIIKNLERRNMAGYYCENMEDAYDTVMSLIADDTVVGWGGSSTLSEIGIKEGLRERKLTVIDPYSMSDPKESMAAKIRLLRSDSFLMSTNAITLDGELVNIDGSGNRVAALCFGPKQVIVVVGANKIVESEKHAISRIKTQSCPPNAIRLKKQTPCGVTGKCTECLVPGETMCCTTMVTRFSNVPKRIKVILVNENLGY
ncbi:lactate utilization protein [Clostridium aminobutyricum]|uniref:Lactate utilization protein n=1 Tax=Clostridium aminobutyricum TaxID=33953 RepID=A0A939D9J5_CLOAM|nr:lactate utilization protein [Clostridium aminobutyricum]MBN7773702.1 lactate utilization protein [Clostridium aminobutyricum]